jgi:aspartyl-tRNA(Asn)/glutamyl-tRNA(Gln) amidotransferase subunit C
MAINTEDVIRVANLARLSLSPSEVQELTEQLGKIVGLVEQLSEVNTDNVEPMVHAIELQNVLAVDQVVPSLPREAALQNAPSADQECFRVPAVLG